MDLIVLKRHFGSLASRGRLTAEQGSQETPCHASMGDQRVLVLTWG